MMSDQRNGLIPENRVGTNNASAAPFGTDPVILVSQYLTLALVHSNPVLPGASLRQRRGSTGAKIKDAESPSETEIGSFTQAEGHAQAKRD